MKRLLLALLVAVPLQAQTTLSVYRGVEEQASYVYQVESRTKAYGFDYFSYIDFFGDRDPGTYFLRSHVSRPMEKGFLAEVMIDDSTGAGNEVIRVGLVKGFNLAGFEMFAKFFPFETDDSGQLACLVFSRKVGKGLRLTGYVDRHINNLNRQDKWVVEPQLELEIHDHIMGLLEYRENQVTGLSEFTLGVRVQ